LHLAHFSLGASTILILSKYILSIPRITFGTANWYSHLVKIQHDCSMLAIRTAMASHNFQPFKEAQCRPIWHIHIPTPPSCHLSLRLSLSIRSFCRVSILVSSLI
jgi:hypothetical protein